MFGAISSTTENFKELDGAPIFASWEGHQVINKTLANPRGMVVLIPIELLNCIATPRKIEMLEAWKSSIENSHTASLWTTWKYLSIFLGAAIVFTVACFIATES